ncbi:MAG: hypothetical protein ACPHJ3_09420 [Rubripirellula sp.]
MGDVRWNSGQLDGGAWGEFNGAREAVGTSGALTVAVLLDPSHLNP